MRSLARQLALPALICLTLSGFIFSATHATQAATDPVFVGAGDIADCRDATPNQIHAADTAALLDTIAGTVFTVGDNVYPTGSAAQYRDCYNPTWGRHKARTRPAPGNHEYQSSGAAPYYAYFGANAGSPGKGYYSYDLDTWHVISLNSETDASASSAQAQWLRADLAAHPAGCTLAYWHKPLFSSGEHGNGSTMRPIWDILDQAGADVVLTGHDHNYERFALQNGSGAADPNGMREFVVGTGGAHQRAFRSTRPNSEKRATNAWGVLKLTLRDGSYDWEFVPIPGVSFRDAGTAGCAGASGTQPTHPPTRTPSPAPAPQPGIIASRVSASVETAPVPHSGDAADDAAIWIHPSDPSQSAIIGTDKQGGIAVYDLAGKQLQYLPDGRLNNVDLRAGFPLGGQLITLVTAGNRSNNTIAIYKVNPTTRMLENVAARTITTLPVYGSCMYRSQASGKFYSFVNSEAGNVEQWELVDSGGKVDARKVRGFRVGSQTEGCVADDELGHFYIGEEKVGIWRYSAEPNGGETRTKVDATGGRLVADVEGLTIATTGRGTGYLIASSQGNSSYAVYRREGNNAYIGSFKIVDGGGVDGTFDTDGIDATTANLGPAFPKGVFIAQDGKNSGGNQNYKLVPFERIIGGSTPPPPTSTPRPDPTASPVPSPTVTPPPGGCADASPQAVRAIGNDGNVPANVLDNNVATRWSHEGVGSWIEFDLGAPRTLCNVGITWYQGTSRINHFVVQGSTDGVRFADLLSADSSGKTLAMERYALPATSARYVRVVVNGNTHNLWASIVELRVSVR